MPEKESCVFCGSSDLVVKPIGGNKGICEPCAEKLAPVLIRTESSKKINGIDAKCVGLMIEHQIKEHKSKDHK